MSIGRIVHQIALLKDFSIWCILIVQNLFFSTRVNWLQANGYCMQTLILQQHLLLKRHSRTVTIVYSLSFKVHSSAVPYFKL